MVSKKKEAEVISRTIIELERENNKLKCLVKDLKFKLLSADEREWARIAYDVFKWEDWEYITDFGDFIRAYIKEKERQIEAELPFD